ncbi:hypothetical protein FRC91_12165 [Bradymonadales bacterium TMQ1]|nr:hypothetical protein FRC91_12165 [Bradymonadales bacterium TMQ1]
MTSPTDEDIAKICFLIRIRSQSNKNAIAALSTHNLFGHMVGVLRLELDSLIRTIYLLTIDDVQERARLAKSVLDGEGFRKATGGRIQDRQMVELSSKLHGWTGLVYKFGCEFIHLSNLHNELTKDPFLTLPEEEKRSIIHYINKYHFVGLHKNSPFSEVASHIPVIFQKISANLECYLKQLESTQLPEP